MSFEVNQIYGDQLAATKPVDCVGEACKYYAGKACDSIMQLLEAKGDQGHQTELPYDKACSYALYGQICTGGEASVVIRLVPESPNQLMGPLEQRYWAREYLGKYQA